ncbi:MAG: hypothetical protein AAF635_04460 [Cyanobacteria bacterium P01_C01_bin.69]
MPATASPTKPTTTITQKDTLQAVKTEVLTQKEPSKMLAVEMPAVERQTAKRQFGDQKLDSKKSDRTEKRAASPAASKPGKTPARSMVQTADQWRNCSKPHRI